MLAGELSGNMCFQEERSKEGFKENLDRLSWVVMEDFREDRETD